MRALKIILPLPSAWKEESIWGKVWISWRACNRLLLGRTWIIPHLSFWVIRPHLTQKITHFISQVIPFYCSIAFRNTILKVLVSDSIIDLLFCWIYILGLKIPSGLKLGKCNGKSFVQVENFPQISQAVWCRCQLQTIYLRCDLL